MCKNITIVVLFVLLVFTYATYRVDMACREFEGWELYSLFPVPTCHVEKNISPLNELRHPVEKNNFPSL